MPSAGTESDRESLGVLCRRVFATLIEEIREENEQIRHENKALRETVEEQSTTVTKLELVPPRYKNAYTPTWRIGLSEPDSNGCENDDSGDGE